VSAADVGPAADDLQTDLEALAAFSEDGPGVNRPAWSPALREAYDWTAARLRAAGLQAHVDPAGNLIGVWEAGAGTAVVVGSHLDSVPRAGRYDGTLGVLTALHAIERLRAAGFAPARPIWLVAFMDEEGTRFGAGMLGSRAFCGEDVTPLLQRADPAGTTVATAMREFGVDPGEVAAAAALDRVGAYLELHIEQGPVLDQTGIDIGVVTAIVGLVALHVTLHGQANHAGTTPMDGRRDALAAAARAVLAVRDVALAADVRATVGELEVRPGAYNVIAGEARLTIDLRAATGRALADAETAIRAALQKIADAEDVTLEIADGHRLAPVPMDPRLRAALDAAAAAEGASSVELVSGAGHDAMQLGRSRPTGMLFVPSRDGISHDPREHTDAADCQTGVRVLARALAALAGG
jgi:allantoate deiminase